MGVNKMVEKMLDTFPVAIHDVDSDNKNGGAQVKETQRRERI